MKTELREYTVNIRNTNTTNYNITILATNEEEAKRDADKHHNLLGACNFYEIESDHNEITILNN